MDTASASVQYAARWPQLTPLSLALVSEQKRLEFLLMRRRGSGYVMDVGRNRSGIDMLKRFGNTLQVLEVATRFRFRSAQARERALPT